MNSHTRPDPSDSVCCIYHLQNVHFTYGDGKRLALEDDGDHDRLEVKYDVCQMKEFILPA